MGQCLSMRIVGDDLEDELGRAEGFPEQPSAFVANIQREQSEVISFPEQPSAFVANIQREQSEVIRERWSLQNEVLAEYGHAASLFCVTPCWRAHTRLLRYVRATAEELKKDKANAKRLSTSGTFNELLAKVVQKGYVLKCLSAAREQKDLMRPDVCIFEAGKKLWNDCAAWRRPYLARVLEILLDKEQPDAIVAKLTEVCDRATRCSSAQRQAFNLLVAHGYHLRDCDSRADCTRKHTLFRAPRSGEAAERTRASNVRTLQTFLDGKQPETRDLQTFDAALMRV